ncbi:His-Xaa-Ser repeat protein HxsA [Thiobacillus denitrificans]|uniref:His-Xaa-Ser repeat protein HxsA n=1 Tax=Thiobacillus denitrificans TaxID=36861 RepID=UPI0009DB3751|nr:His-Xaa-Ser repeat protein HxsA [Thiobacillus denitrificans]
MKHLKTPLAFLAAWLSFVPGKSLGVPADNSATAPSTDGLDPVSLRPLNRPGDNMFAAHRSHSSHGSHRSSSGGGGVYRAPSTPQPSVPQRSQESSSSLYGSGSSQPTDPGRASAVSPMPAQAAPKLSTGEKRKLQIMRVQIALTSLGLYQGTVDGVLNDGTKESLTLFQNLKGIEPNGLMSTETLNALGVPAVQ